MVDPELPAPPPPPRPRRSSYASYAQPVPPPTADGGDGRAAVPAPYAGWAPSSISADGSYGGSLPLRRSSGGDRPPQRASSAASDTTSRSIGSYDGTSSAQSGHAADPEHAGANGAGGTWPAVAGPSPGYMRAGTALGKAGFQARTGLYGQQHAPLDAFISCHHSDATLAAVPV